MRQLTFSPLASIGSHDFIYDRPTDKWTLNEDAVNRLFCATGNAGSTGIRVIPYNPWNEHPHGLSSQFQPYAMNADRSKFDLGNFNSWYFPLVRRYVEVAKTYGQTTWFALLDNCQFAGSYDRWSPWSNNVQGIGTFYESKAWPFVKTWFEKCIDEFGVIPAGVLAKMKALFQKTNLDVRFPWFNEGAKNSIAVAREAIIPVILKRKLDWSKMAYGATMEEVDYKPMPAGWVPTPDQPKWDYYPGMAGTIDWLKKLVADTLGGQAGDAAKLKIWKEVHSIGGKGYPQVPNRLHQALYWWARTQNNGIRIWLSNDGVFDGNSVCDVEQDGAVTKRRPSAERMAEIVKSTLVYGNDFTYEHLPKTRDLACITATLRAMYKAMTGADPVVKYHYTPPVEPPEPPQPPEPPVPPTPPEPNKSCYQKYIANRPLSKWQIGKFLSCLMGGRK